MPWICWLLMPLCNYISVALTVSVSMACRSHDARPDLLLSCLMAICRQQTRVRRHHVILKDVCIVAFRATSRPAFRRLIPAAHCNQNSWRVMNQLKHPANSERRRISRRSGVKCDVQGHSQGEAAHELWPSDAASERAGDGGSGVTPGAAAASAASTCSSASMRVGYCSMRACARRPLFLERGTHRRLGWIDQGPERYWPS